MLFSATADYRRKVKTAEDVRAIVGARPRQRRVVMCHGVFDLVHPGHIRHLLYAKEKADILVASITADIHIKKGNYRPFVPQDLRALNLAALELVDYVIIDPQPTPIENIGCIQPDYFAKGYEYSDGGIPAKTQEEITALRQYGGEILFTPGDIVYSSSHLIETDAPDIGLEKLLMLMEAEGLNFDRLRSIVSKWEGKTVHVVGDTIVDSLTHTTMIGGMTKTPTPSVRFENRVDYIGGAAIVAKHLAAAGANAVFSTVLGEDPLKDFVLDGLKESRVRCLPLTEQTRPTTHKNAFVCGDYRLLKVDMLDNRSITEQQVDRLRSQIRDVKSDAVVFCDFRHGIFNRRTIPDLTAAIPPDAFRVADSQVASRWGNILDFKGFHLLTPNEREARFALADQDTGVRPLAEKLHDHAECKTLILKLGDRGVLTSRMGSGAGDLRSFFVVDSFTDKVVDAVGAGDALLAYATLSLLVDPSEVAATILGSLAAALECEVDGNIPIRRADLIARLDAVEKRARFE
jgi:cytidyltransferase-like protein